MRVYLDDVRVKPDTFDLHVRTAAEAIGVLKAGNVTHISLDHDLGDGVSFGTGYDVVCWLEKEVLTNPNFKMPTWEVHSANPVGRLRMIHALVNLEERCARERGQ